MPPAPILKTIPFKLNGDSLSVEILCDTLLFVTYRIELRETNNSNGIDPFPIEGDNANPEADKHHLPVPVSSNHERRLWIFFTILDQTGDGGKYTIDAIIRQGDVVLNQLSTGSQDVASAMDQLFVARLIGE